MKARYHRLLLLSLSALGIGLLFAVIGLPYGPLTHTAFADLYHEGGATHAPAGHLYIDCEPGGAVDEVCDVTGPTHTVDVYFEDNSAPGTIGSFAFYVRNTEPGVLNAIAEPVGPDGNPDFNEAVLGAHGPSGWDCVLAQPSPVDDTGAYPGDEEHLLACFHNTAAGPGYAQSSPVKLASIEYTVGSAGTTVLSFTGGVLSNNNGGYIVDCTGEDGIIGTADDPCFGAVLSYLDGDHDAHPDASDNCPLTANPGQANADRNFIELSPQKMYDDLTLAMSDTMGDACDADDDNDGLTDADEASGTTCGAPTDPLERDSDGDRIIDGAECTVSLTDPNTINATNPAVCQAAGDADGDKVLDSREVCYYGTSPNNVNSDGDTRNDACEVASINGDLMVNVLDLQQIAAEIQAYPSGNYPDPGSAVARNFDITKHGSLGVSDLMLAAVADTVCP